MLKTGIKAEKAGSKAESRVPEKAEVERAEQEFALWNEWLQRRTASAVAVVIFYRPTLARYSVHKDGADFVFAFGEPAQVDPTRWKESAQVDVWKEGDPLDAHQVRKDFERVGNPAEALDFLSRTGAFLPHAEEFTWSQFQRWQRLLYMVRERKELEDAAQRRTRNGEAAEALKAIEGNYDSAFFSADQQRELSQWFRNPRG